MIQASTTKNIEPKALKGVDGKVKANQKAAGQKGKADTEAFASELEASLATGVEVKPVEVAAEQAMELPSTLVNPAATASGNSETASPKIFDPSLTSDVEKLIQPKTTEVATPVVTDKEALALVAGTENEVQAQEAIPGEVDVELKNEITQALLKTPQLPGQPTKEVMTGRAPAIEFAQSEVDPQLLNLEDFVAQKNLAVKKNIQGQAYGMAKVQPEQKLALETDLKQSEVVTDLESSKSPMNSQQFILNMMSDQKSNHEVSDVQAPTKVFDMSHIKSSNGAEIVNKITDYIVQAKVAKEPTVNMRMNHDELGMIDITVSKTGGVNQAIAINIGAHSLEGKTFFQQNTRELFSHMANAGLNVSDMKIETPSQTAKNDFDFGQQSRQGNPGQDKQFASEQNQRRHDQARRQDLWKLLNKEAA